MPDNKHLTTLAPQNVHSQTIPQVLDAFRAAKEGLSGSEARRRLLQYGHNVLPSAHPAATRLKLFASQWKNPLIVILIVAGAVSGLLGEFTDMTIILLAAGINTIVGFIQEDKANQALKKLRSFVTHSCVVLRDGRKQQLPSEDIVPGDIFFVSAGDQLQADARLIRAIELRVNEAQLTGESEPIKKHTDPVAQDRALADRENMLYRGSIITAGVGMAVVVGTGANTELGRIAALVKETPEEDTPLQEQLAKLARTIGIVVLALAGLLFGMGQLVAAARYSALELFQTAVAVAVAAIPEGLVISLTVMLAISMQQILKRRALVRRMLAAETLGSVGVICTDKTGTLTLGDMRVTRIVTANDDLDAASLRALDPRDTPRHGEIIVAARIGVLANNGALQNPEAAEKEWQFIGDTTDVALVRAGMQAGLPKHHLDEAIPRISEIPFTSERKFHATLHAADQKAVLYVKGAPEVIMERAAAVLHHGEARPWSADDRQRFETLSQTLAAEGYRLLAAAYRQFDGIPRAIADGDVQGLVFVGLIAIADPVRADVKETIALCRRAGIRIIMVTGDHKRTAAAVGRILGLPGSDGEILEGRDIAAMNDVELAEALARTSLFARVDPEHKLRIVQTLRAQGEVVAVTGDGVNDAPALKAADIGIAVGSGTDVAKETADVVLLDDSFSTIVSAIQEGRRLYQNIKKVVLYLLSGSFAEVVLIGGSILGGLPLAVLPAQILWVNIIEDSFPTIALAFDKGEKENMDEPPRGKNAPLLDRNMKILIAIISIVSNLVLFGLFLYFWKTTGDIARTRTLMFVGLGIDSLLYIYSVRSMRRHMWQMPLFDNQYLTGAVAVGGVLLVVAVHAPPLQTLLRTVPLSAGDWGMMTGFGLFNVLLIEFVKHLFLNRQGIVDT